MRVFNSLPTALFLLTLQCSSSDPSPGGTLDGGPSAQGGSGGLGGTGGTAGGGGSVPGACGGIGGQPPYCSDGVVHGDDPYCNSYAHPCPSEKPVCVVAACTTCPAGVGPEMVSVGDVCVDTTEVTRAQYEAWLSASPSVQTQFPLCAWNDSFLPDPSCLASPNVCSAGCDDHPQVCVDWCDAAEYCLSAGKRLCGGRYGVGASWEWDEACNDNTAAPYPYPGSYDAGKCNDSELGVGTTVPVGSTPGCTRLVPGGAIRDLTGNVWEWEDQCTGDAGAADPCRARGGSFEESGEQATCSAVDESLARSTVAPNLGFRCCGP